MSRVITSALPLAYSTNSIPNDIDLTNANQFYDGPSLTLAAGTWLLTGAVTLQSSNAASDMWTAKLWDGTTSVAMTQSNKRPAGGEGVSLAISGVAVLATSATWKISVADSLAGSRMYATTPNNGGALQLASTLTAVRIG